MEIDKDKNGLRKLTFLADEGYEAVILEMIGKNTITPKDFNDLVKGLLLNAYKKNEGRPVLIKRDFSLVCIAPFYK